MADQGTDSIKTPLLEKAELPSAPPPDAQHASSEPSPPQYSESAYPPPSSAAPRQPPYPPSAQPVSCPYPSQPYPPDAAQGPPTGGTGYPASAPPVSMPTVSYSVQSDSRLGTVKALILLVIVRAGKESLDSVVNEATRVSCQVGCIGCCHIMKRVSEG